MKRTNTIDFQVSIATDDGDRYAWVTATVLHEREGRHHPEVFDVEIDAAEWLYPDGAGGCAMCAARADEDHIREQIRDGWED